MRNNFCLKLCLLLFGIVWWGSINAQIVEVNSIECSGDSTGQLAVVANFGATPYTYLWSNGLTTPNIDGLHAGNYAVTVTESGGASMIYSYQLTSPLPVTATYTLAPNSTWPVNSGSILISPNGGSGWYNYSLYDSTSHKTTNQSNPFFGTLASGAYYITISDLYDCGRTDTIHISENAGLAVAVSIDTTACYMSKAPSSVQPSLAAVYPVVVSFDNATIFTILDTVNGPRPYVMSIPGDTLASIGSQFAPGFHLLTVVAADGTGFRYSWTVDSVVAPISISWTKTNDICFGNHTAQITSLAQGSWMGFTYHISGPNGFSINSNSASGLYAGEYSIVARDFTGCTISQTVLISQPDEPLHVVFDESVNPHCSYSADGKIIIHRVDGATNPITYSWSSGEHTPTIDSLFPGVYIITVSDANSCAAKDSITLRADRKACIFNVVTPNGDGYNDYLDLTNLCKSLKMQAVIFNEAGNKIATLDETKPRWDPSDPANPPTGTASTYTVFIDLTKNGQSYMQWAESFSVIYPK